MSIIRDDSFTVDYTEEFEALLGFMERLTVANETIATNIAAMKLKVDVIADTDVLIQLQQKQFVDRAISEVLGIFIDSVHDEAHRLSRAATVNALREAEQLDNVSAEMSNPTPIG